MSVFMLGSSPTVADATAQFTLGTEAVDPRTRDFGGNVIRYVKANGTIAVNSAVRMDFTDETNEPHAVLATSATGQIVAGVSIAALASSGTNQFGWITVKGKTTVLTAAVAAGALLVTTATAGTLDDFATNTDVTAAIIASFSGPPIVSLDSTAATDGTIQVFVG